MVESFVCRRCGRCCRWPGYVRVLPEEIDAMAAELGIAPGEFIERYTEMTRDRRGLSLTEAADGGCVMLGDAGGGRALCRVQAAKPRQCREFPRGWNFPGWEKECPGAATGE